MRVQILNCLSKMLRRWWGSPPLGMLYIATYLRENGIDVSIIDEAAQGYSLKGTVDWVKKENPDILGFSTCSSSGRKAALIAERVKKGNPNIVTVFGNFLCYIQC